MNVLQSYYTSCKQGQLGGTGFQFYAHSPGLSEAELKELSIIGNYVPPAGLPTQPTPEEVAELFPISFSYFRLKSGRVGVCNSQYIGRDYSGRYGNFFAHCLVLETGEIPCYPIQLLGSDLFRTALSEAELNRNTTPPPLAVLNATEIFPPFNKNINQLEDFFTNEVEIVFTKMVDATLKEPDTQRRLVFSAPPRAVANWLQALTMSFPLAQAQAITFTTYSFDPANTKFRISATPSGNTRFDFSNDMSRNFQYFTFDLAAKQYSKIEHGTEFSQMLPLAFTISSDKLFDFHQFLTHFDYPEMGLDIDDALGLYRLVNARSTVKKMRTENLFRALAFARDKAEIPFLKELLQYFGQGNNTYDLVQKLTSFNESERVISILFVIAGKVSDSKLLSPVGDVYSDSLLTFIDNEGKGLSLKNIPGFFSYLSNTLTLDFAKSKFFRQNLLAPKRMQLLQEIVRSDKNELPFNRKNLAGGLLCISIQEHLGVTLTSTTTLGQFYRSCVASLVKAHVSFVTLLQYLVKTPELLINTLIIARETGPDKAAYRQNIYQAFVETYNVQDEGSKTALDQALNASNEIEAILALANDNVNTPEKAVVSFEAFFARYEDFFQRHPVRFADFTLNYLRSLSFPLKKDKLSLVLRLAKPIPSVDFNQELLQLLEQKTDLSRPQKITGELLISAERIRSRTRQPTARNGLAYLAQANQLEEEEINLATFFRRTNNLGSLNCNSREEVLEWVMEAILPEFKDRRLFPHLFAFIAQNYGSDHLSRALAIVLSYGFREDTMMIIKLISYLGEGECQRQEPANSRLSEQMVAVKKLLPRLLAKRKTSILEEIKDELPSKSHGQKYWSEILKKRNKYREANGITDGFIGLLKSRFNKNK